RVDATVTRHVHVVQLLARHLLLMRGADPPAHLERAVPAHVLEWRETFGGRALGQAGDRVGEHPAVVLVDRELRPGPLLRLEPAADAERAVRIDAPRQLDPELVLLPHLTRVC